MLEINTKFYNGIMFIRLNGVLSKKTKNKFKLEVTNIIKENRIKNIVFNFSDLKNIDNEGIKLIYETTEINKKNFGKSLICNSDKYITNKFEKYKFLIAENELEAINAIAKC